MTRTFPDVSTTDYIDTGLMRLLSRDESALSTMSGEGAPSVQIENLVYLDLSNKKLYLKSTPTDKELIDYGDGIITTLNLSTSYQALNSALTDFSTTTINGSGVIAKNAFIKISSLTRTSVLAENDISGIRKNLGMKKLSVTNKIGISQIDNNTIPEDKFNFTIETEPPLKTGDILYSYKNKGRSDFVILQEGTTIGNAASGAIYRGDKYLDLFKLFWPNPDNQVYTSFGETIEKGESAVSDFNNNKRLQLPRKLDKYNTTLGAVFTVEVGKTFTHFVKNPGYYSVTLAGGGGGSVARSQNHDKWWNHAGTGGSGAGFSSLIYFPGNTTITITVGAAGSGTIDGGDTILTASGIQGRIFCGGGKSATAVGENPYAGVGGTYENTLALDSNPTVASNGGNGTTVWGVQAGGVLQGTQVFTENTYGKAADAPWSSAINRNYVGYDGVGILQYLGPKSTIESSQALYDFINGLTIYVKI